MVRPAEELILNLGLRIVTGLRALPGVQRGLVDVSLNDGQRLLMGDEDTQHLTVGSQVRINLAVLPTVTRVDQS